MIDADYILHSIQSILSEMFILARQ